MNAMKPAETESFDAAELGAMMREMRENLGHDLESVASDLRIRLVYIEAIEAGRLSDLPGNAYISGFLRAYSDFLGLDGAEIVRRFKMAGAEISTRFAPASICGCEASFDWKKPVHSRTMSTPMSPCGKSPGLRSEVTIIFLPSTMM